MSAARHVIAVAGLFMLADNITRTEHSMTRRLPHSTHPQGEVVDPEPALIR